MFPALHERQQKYHYAQPERDEACQLQNLLMKINRGIVVLEVNMEMEEIS